MEKSGKEPLSTEEVRQNMLERHGKKGDKFSRRLVAVITDTEQQDIERTVSEHAARILEERKRHSDQS